MTNQNEYLNITTNNVGEVKVNGKSFFGRSVVINGSSVIVDGKEVSGLEPTIKVEILGSCESVNTTSGDVHIKEAAQQVKTMSGDVTCGPVFGNVSTMSGDVRCGDISGSVSTMSGDILNKG
ncbi:hypothetical protein JUNP543_1124 [Acinetobacter baumannii]|uniref:Uncharacterized protein n=1 Tax=Acinetobacter baumannii TaxID=470 RepID=A0A1Y1P934_ACIBA|nr:hypothetical protein [Acinetobacter baumannii]KMV03214.1 hypothetical protein AB994_1957 [Acinetobacter baumannii]KMV09157.1 hypothetical protein AB994_3875 [Acinetobacter baumannii]MEE1860742.1 hypothetical protein [Acinetobacter baumannii]NCG58438.1 hypothetical protein [Acinetobacter baumannii]NDW42635.1 hypothetical protein [Acinetobacter baumannii]